MTRSPRRAVAVLTVVLSAVIVASAQIIEILDGVLANAEHPEKLDKPELELALCTASIPLAAIAQFAVPALLPVSAALFAYTSIPSFRRAYEVLTKERRLGVDVLATFLKGEKVDARVFIKHVIIDGTNVDVKLPKT